MLSNSTIDHEWRSYTKGLELLYKNYFSIYILPLVGDVVIDCGSIKKQKICGSWLENSRVYPHER